MILIQYVFLESTIISMQTISPISLRKKVRFIGLYIGDNHGIARIAKTDFALA